MKTQHLARTALLSAAVCAVLAGSGQARTLTPDPSDVVRQNDARHSASVQIGAPQIGAVLPEPTLAQMLEAFNFQDADHATLLLIHETMAGQLAARGLSKTGRGFVDAQQIDSWYSAAEDRSVVCVTGADGGRYSQVVYVMAGKVRRTDSTPF